MHGRTVICPGDPHHGARSANARAWHSTLRESDQGFSSASRCGDGRALGARARGPGWGMMVACAGLACGVRVVALRGGMAMGAGWERAVCTWLRCVVVCNLEMEICINWNADPSSFCLPW